jgi:hypothetical protein
MIPWNSGKEMTNEQNAGWEIGRRDWLRSEDIKKNFQRETAA